jgi:hypothetical protein
MHINAIIARVFLLILTCVAGVPAGADQRSGPWTADDSGAAAEAAIAAASDNKSKPTELSKRMELADALIKAGNIPKAKQVVEDAASNLGFLQSSYLRGQIVEKLALLGNARAAEALAAAEVTQSAKIALFGKVGVGRARSGNIADARRAARTINSLPRDSTTAAPADASARALADISIALAESGAIAKASKMAMPLPDGLPKVQALSQVARLACKKGNAQTSATRRGRLGLEQATAAARAAIAATDKSAAIAATNKPVLKINVAVAAGEAVASCNGADGAQSFVDETLTEELRDQAAASLVDRLTQQNEFTIARSLLSAADPMDTHRLFDTARRFMKLGDRAKAIELAVKARHAVLGPKPGVYYGNPPQPGQIVSLLTELGAYDEAIAAAKAIKTDNLSRYYVYAVNAAARNSDAASVARLLPVTFDALKTDSKPDRADQFRSLSDLTRTLAVAGYRDQALQAFAELQELMAKEPANSWIGQGVTSLAAVLQADKGDIAGALEAADGAGAMVAKPDRLTIIMLAAMTMGQKREKPPTEAEVLEAIRQAEALMPLVVGPKAQVLSDIAMHMAAKEDIAAALRAAASLEQEQNGAIKVVHDNAVTAIVNAQIKAGDLRGALATALRIRQSDARWKLLLKLAGSPITR